MASSTSSSSGGPDAASEADERQPFKKKRSGWDVQSARDGTNSLSASFTHVLSSFMQQNQTPSSSLNGSLLNAAVPSKADHRIYIGSINYEVTETQMRKLFEPFGQIVKVDMSVDPSNGKTKGFCFIEYQNLASVQAAMVMDGFELANRKIKVGRPANATTPLQPIIDLNAIPSIAPQLLSPTTTNSLLPNLATAAVVSSSDATMLAAVGSVSKKITVKNVHSAFSEAEVKSIFAPFGSINSCSANGKGEDTKEVNIEYKTPSCAQQALALNGFHLGGVPLVITFSN